MEFTPLNIIIKHLQYFLSCFIVNTTFCHLGAGHGGRGGQGSEEMATGAPHGHLFEPSERGCHGGGGDKGGRGGGIVWLTVYVRLQVDGQVSSNGAPGTATGGGGSGGSVLIRTELIQVR